MNVGGVGSGGGAGAAAVAPSQGAGAAGTGTGTAGAGAAGSDGAGIGQQKNADNSTNVGFHQDQNNFISTQDQIGMRPSGGISEAAPTQSGQMDMNMQFMIKMMMMMMLMKMMQDMMQQGGGGGFSAVA